MILTSKKKIVPEPNEYLRRHLEAWKNLVLAIAKVLEQEKEQKNAS